MVHHRNIERVGQKLFRLTAFILISACLLIFVVQFVLHNIIPSSATKQSHLSTMELWVDFALMPTVLLLVLWFVRFQLNRWITPIHRLTEIALLDPLTGLANRRYIEQKIQDLIDEYTREPALVFSVIFIDLDGFKLVNDALGHAMGDELIRKVAERLTKLVDDGVVGRIGGDEFIVLCQKDRDQTELLVTRLLEIATPFLIDGMEISLTASIGISTFPDDGKNVTELLKRADSAMYTAKKLGKNTFQFFDEEGDKRTYRKVQVLRDMRFAVSQSEFILYYQPQVDLRNRRVVGAEALLRWNHPTLGLLSPEKFMPIAEESGLMIQIGKWVIQAAIKDCVHWQQTQSDVTASVNLSPTQFLRPDLPQFIHESLVRLGLSPSSLIIEITESTMMHFETATLIIDNLKKVGVRISIDDFGTGFSSLAYLRNYNVDELKIDSIFIRDMLHNSKDKAIVSSMISLAKAMQLQVVAEAVESYEQLTCLQELACDVVQGYLLSQPLPLQQLVDWQNNVNDSKSGDIQIVAL